MTENIILKEMVLDICGQHLFSCDDCPMSGHMCFATAFERHDYTQADKEYLINTFASYGRDLSLLERLPAEINLAEEECINLFQ